MDMVHIGLQICFANLKADIKTNLDTVLASVGAMILNPALGLMQHTLLDKRCLRKHGAL